MFDLLCLASLSSTDKEQGTSFPFATSPFSEPTPSDLRVSDVMETSSATVTVFIRDTQLKPSRGFQPGLFAGIIRNGKSSFCGGALLNWQEVSLVLLGSHFSTIQRQPAHE